MSKYNIKVQFEQETLSFLCSEDQDVISAKKMNGIDLPNFCSGVCIDCGTITMEESIEQEDAMDLNDDLRDKAFSSLCVAYPYSNLNNVIGKEVGEDLYNDQFGKFQK